MYLFFTLKLKKFQEPFVEALILSYSEGLVNRKSSYLQALIFPFTTKGRSK
jgi:hypothetical protein